MQDIVNDEYEVNFIDPDSENSCKAHLNSFFFGKDIDKFKVEHRIKNVCESAAIFRIQRSWERPKNEEEDDEKKAITNATPLAFYTANENNEEEDADEMRQKCYVKEEDFTLEFLNACYMAVKNKMRQVKENETS